MFCCVNGIVSNPFKFSAGQEAAAELTAIVCQLLFMGTLAHELGKRSHVSEPLTGDHKVQDVKDNSLLLLFII